MLVKLLILAIVFYLGYRWVKAWLIKNLLAMQQNAEKPLRDDIDDEMIQDPVCKVYFPKRQGVVLRHHGQELYFCSEECRDRYVGKR